MDDRTLFRRHYVLFLAARSMGAFANTAFSVVIAWEVYALARQSMDEDRASAVLGTIGLVQFLPMLSLALPAGEVADRHNRRTILVLCYVALALISLVLAVLSSMVGELWPLFVSAAFFGASRAFFQPTASSLGPMLVPIHLLPRAISTNSLAVQLSSILGPAVGGFLCSIDPTYGFSVCATLYCLSTVCILAIRADTQPKLEEERSRLEKILEGLHYVWTNKLVLGAISLDLFAVLLAGATGLLPVYARDILQVGPEGFGILRAAPAVGALLVAAFLSVHPIVSGVGVKMFASVLLFGIATIAFAYSTSLWLSVGLLAVLGGADMISVFTRQSLVQIATPDRMRGRVSAVSTLFISASNELGEFESGATAGIFGPVRAVALGGAGAVVVTGLWAWLFPALRKADRFA